MNCINEAILAVGEGAMVDPNVASAENRHPVPIGQSPPPVVAGRVPHIGIPTLLTVMYVQSVNDHIRHILYGDARPAGDVHARSSAVDRLERVDHQLLLELDHHVTVEDDPQWLVLDGTVPKCPWLGVHRVVSRVCHHVNLAVTSSDRVLPKPDRAVRQPLPVLIPIGVTAPAVVNGVACPA